MTCVLNTVLRNCPFHEELSKEDNDYREEKSREAYQKGRIDLLCSLVGYQFISLEVGAYMAGMDRQNFEKAFHDWQYEWMDDIDE